jgi:two-component system invasion response regulator UvrY
MLKILIVDDHAVVRTGLRQFLAGADDCRIGGEAANGAEALAQIAAESWDLLLLDIGLPDINGIDLLRRIKREKPTLPVLIFSMFAEDDYAMTALEAGAAGFLPKESEPAQILAAIRCVGRGERYLSAHLAEKLIAGTIRPDDRPLHDFLSKRETTVMLMISRGLALTDIGDALHLSPKTITSYRARVLQKLKLGSNAELTRYVIEHKLDT